MMTYNGGARGGTQIPLLTPIATAGETHGIFRNKKPLTKSTLVIYHKKKKGHYESKEEKKETTRAEHLHKNLHRGNYTLKGSPSSSPFAVSPASVHLFFVVGLSPG